MDKREFLRELRDPPEYVIDAISGIDTSSAEGASRRNAGRLGRSTAIDRWQRAIDELIYRA